ncbi:MAG: hypothetical protein IAI50_19280 [Candidatus Eremiobacteraeota bacterium]|nr:hypothetical protein [Candidatus Eremiobacteraeota bacterium]
MLKRKHRGHIPEELVARAIELHSSRTFLGHRLAIEAIHEIAERSTMLSPVDLLLAAMKAAPDLTAAISAYLGTFADEVISSSRSLRYEPWTIFGLAQMEFDIDPKQCF